MKTYTSVVRTSSTDVKKELTDPNKWSRLLSVTIPPKDFDGMVKVIATLNVPSAWSQGANHDDYLAMLFSLSKFVSPGPGIKSEETFGVGKTSGYIAVRYPITVTGITTLDLAKGTSATINAFWSNNGKGRCYLGGRYGGPEFPHTKGVKNDPVLASLLVHVESI